ncbi:Protein NETWORKED 2D [Abeliophyllum distichum]|uniref:Protein NETWORKED 2D n=1 Tax=Abeliophyllum distichum TaxID=126358 RepID=A0ABD1V1V3_9LAMI
MDDIAGKQGNADDIDYNDSDELQSLVSDDKGNAATTRRQHSFNPNTDIENSSFSVDMEVKVQDMLKLIDEDGDSFAKRAEMYYQKRPELIQFVEESFRAFRALAERYDHLSKDLQNANHTLGTVCPEKLQFAVDEDYESSSPGFRKNSEVPKLNKAAIKYLKNLKTTGSEQLQVNKYSEPVESNEIVAKSGLSKSEALEQIDKLQKDILVLETVKEFVKTSYESGIAKYRGLEDQIMEMQQRLCSLQDEFNVENVVEDAEAHTLMAETALKSCEETLINLQEKQDIYSQEAREEYNKIEDASRRLKSLRHEYLYDETDDKRPTENDESKKVGHLSESSTKEADEVILEKHVVEEMWLKKAPVDPGSMESLAVMELTEKIDELVNKVISLETGMSSQNVLITSLRTEADDLHAKIRDLENEKETLINGTHNISSRVKELEERLQMIQELSKNVEDQNNNFHANFIETRSSFDHLSEKLTSVKPDEAREVTDSLQDNKDPVDKVKLQDDLKNQKVMPGPGHVDKNSSALKTEDGEKVKDGDITDQGREASDHNRQTEGKKVTKKTVTILDPKPEENVSEEHSAQRGNELLNNESQGDEEKKEELNWQLMLLHGLEDREKILLDEYTTILRNYKDMKRKLSDMEKKARDAKFETTVQIRGTKSAIAKRDAEIRKLCQRLKLLQGKLGENNDFELNDDANLPIKNEEDKIKFVFIDKDPAISVVEEKLQRDIDAIRDENLDFWLRFSTAFQQIKKFKTEVQDLQDEVSKINEKKNQEGRITPDLKPDYRLIYKHLREIQTELTVWVEQNISLKNELNRRFESLCHIEEEIKKVFEGFEEDEIVLRSYQAAKFQGEIFNMKHEYKKIGEELQAGLDRVSEFQLESESTLRKLNDEFGISGDQPQSRHSMNRPRVPLRVFIFGAKPKKHRHSIFSCIRPNKKFKALRGGISKKSH